ncbi:hypothetical protein V6N12_058231 [Hibiscus sabdariffa]|uniref:Uncharacterized protein n=1 Tax=Hibiscus sabdariffa TaxID=183260 RepID=A0ABR2ETC9_9ROSI
MRKRYVVSWTSTMVVYAKASRVEGAFGSGYLEEFKKFVKSLPFEPNVAVLTRAFDACMKHDAVRYGEWAAEQHN